VMRLEVEMELSTELIKPRDGPNLGRGFSWLVATLLLLCLMLNYLDRQSLAVLVRFLSPPLHMSNIVYGRIQALFLLAYALAMPLTGWVIDRLGAKTGLALSVALWSVTEALHGTARNLITLGSYRFLLGIPESAGLPAMAKVAGEHAAPHAKATLIGIAMFGLGLGITVAPPVVSFLTLHFDWRWAFYGTALAGFVWIALWLMFYRSGPNSSAILAASARSGTWGSSCVIDRRLDLLSRESFRTRSGGFIYSGSLRSSCKRAAWTFTRWASSTGFLISSQASEASLVDTPRGFWSGRAGNHCAPAERSCGSAPACFHLLLWW
jgi:MFS family permease